MGLQMPRSKVLREGGISMHIFKVGSLSHSEGWHYQGLGYLRLTTLGIACNARPLRTTLVYLSIYVYVGEAQQWYRWWACIPSSSAAPLGALFFPSTRPTLRHRAADSSAAALLGGRPHLIHHDDRGGRVVQAVGTGVDQLCRREDVHKLGQVDAAAVVL
jgi:hypothetical protein